MRKTIPRPLSGTSCADEREYEIKNRAVSRAAAADGMVLLKNEGGLLPLSKEKPVALYGAGAVVTIKGGSGSGDVNSRHTVSIAEGMKNAGYTITTSAWLDAYKKTYDDARLAWKDEIRAKADAAEDTGNDGGVGIFMIYSTTPFSIPAGSVPEAKDAADDADTAVYVLARTAGEGADRDASAGDYFLTEGELSLLNKICSLYEHVVLVLNTGGPVDLAFTDEKKNIEAILHIHQPGMEAGNAFADVISGAVTPSAKLTDTWAGAYEDYPNAKTFSHINGNVEKEKYIEGIYVGYRYFDTFDKPCRYPFGYGLSYTDFEIRPEDFSLALSGNGLPRAGVRLSVENTGKTAGKETVQLYAACPQNKLEKEFRRLVAFKKTKLLESGESAELEITFPLYSLASYDESLPGWVMEKGKYIIMAGNSINDTQVCAIIEAVEDIIFSRTQNICPLKEELSELKQCEKTAAQVKERRDALINEAKDAHRPIFRVSQSDITTEIIEYNGAYGDMGKEVCEFTDTLSQEELILLATGDISKGQGMNEEDGQLGSAGTSVPGSAAQTSDCAADRGLADIVLADGPAGLRLSRTYQSVDGKPQAVSLLAALEGGFLLEGREEEAEGETRFQYCTAFPAGTSLAQSWDTDLIEEVGRAVRDELLEFGITLWLAPGMNIHRNPLCGRNFEYYSEDPLLSGLCAAAMTNGVQGAPGVGTTIKHFACNNQEDNRMGSDSILSERTLREIYLKGFEIAIKTSHPMSVMTSYNFVNGVHSANSFDLCTKAARCEWGFEGVIMTDWTTTMQDDTCTAAGCMRAGNDLVMPGAPSDHENLRKCLANGTLKIEDLKRSVSRLVKTSWNSRYSEEI